MKVAELREYKNFEAGDEVAREVVLAGIKQIISSVRERMGDRFLFDVEGDGMLIHSSFLEDITVGRNAFDMTKLENPPLNVISTLLDRRYPENLSDCADYFYLQFGRLPTLGSVGFGPGEVEEAFLREGKASSVVGVEPNRDGGDYEEEDGDFVRKYVSTSGRNFDELDQAVADEVEGVDMLLLGDSMHHTSNPYRALRACYEKMGDYGFGFVSEPFHLPEDNWTPSVLYRQDDCTDHHDSMLSLKQHERWVNWILINGGRILHARLVPGNIAGDRNSYFRSEHVPVDSVAENDKRHEGMREAGLVSRLEDGFNRLQVVFEKGHIEPFYTVPNEYLKTEKKTLDEMDSVFDLFPLCLLDEPERRRIMDLFARNSNSTLEGFNKHDVKGADMRRSLLWEFSWDIRCRNLKDYSMWCMRSSPFASSEELMEIFMNEDLFGDSSVMFDHLLISGEIFLMYKLLKEFYGIDIQDRLMKFKNWRSYKPWGYEKAVYDPHKLLAPSPVGIDTHYEHPVPNPEVAMPVALNVSQRFHDPDAFSYVLPDENEIVKNLETESDIFELWPLSLVRGEDRSRVLTALYEGWEGYDFIDSLKELSDQSVRTLRKGLVGILLGKGKNAEQFVDESRPSQNLKIALKGWKLRSGEQSGAERDEAAGEVLALVKLLSTKCKLGYVIDLIAKEEGWMTILLAVHPECKNLMILGL